MSFAEQLAARAAATQSHHHSRNESLGSPPPRPGKITNRAVGISSGSGGRGVTRRSASPSLFADQLKRRAKNDNRGLQLQSLDSSHTPDDKRERRINIATPSSRPKSTTSKSFSNSFVDQISERSAETCIRSEPGHSHRLMPSSDAPSDSSWLHEAESGDDDDDETNDSTKERSCRPSLIPIRDSSNEEYSEEEDDDYASVGFSLMDASTVSTVDEEHGDKSEGGGSKVTPPRLRLQPVLNKSHQRQIGHNAELQQQQRQEEIPFQNYLSPIQKVQYPQQQQNDSELQSKLQRQLLKCQTTKSQPVQHSSQAIPQIRDSNECSTETSVNNDSSANPIFGAWAQIESLQQRVREAEERAMEESHRAELASYELKLVKEEQSFSRDCDEAATAASSSIVDNRALGKTVRGPPAAVTVRESEIDASAKEQEKMNYHLSSSSFDVPREEKMNNSRLDTSHGASQEEGTLQWKKRALEAEERLAKEVERLERAAAAATAASTAPQPVMSNSDPHTTPQTAATPTSRREESDLICLKNAEIDVLRSQIHRLERRILEECERNEDFLRTPPYRHHHDAPPLVVASECMNSPPPPGATTNIDEFRLLRNEIRHLQYQLRTKDSHDARGTTSADSTTGESTLSSLDGNDRGEDVEDEEENNMPSSPWGLCCIRRSRRGYGRVMKS